MQYDFAPVSEEGVLQGNLPGSLTASELQLGTERKSELVSAESSFSKPSKPSKAQPACKRRLGDFSATVLPQEGSPQPVMERKHPLNDSQPSLVYEEAQSTAPSELGPTSRKHQPSLNPTPFQPSPSEKESCGGPDCCHSHSGGPAEPTEDEILAKGWEKRLLKFNLAHYLNSKAVPLEKPYNCPDCGRAFVHQSSIPRHQKLHRKETFSPTFGQERSPNLDLKPLSHPKLLSGKEKPTYHPVNSTEKAKNQSNLSCQGASTLSSVCVETDSPSSEPCTKQAGVEKPFPCSECGRSFNLKSTMIRHQKLHLGERPFKCPLCDKSYGQKGHLKRHYQQKHSNHLIQKESP
ncbi:zinc finger protein 629-like [Anolis carolinensis]|uniref:zinc finger protein 629-like n=1 Tax=Anolis carolinensis TaxID=28377 RepID=UPI002F2B3FA6